MTPYYITLPKWEESSWKCFFQPNVFEEAIIPPEPVDSKWDHTRLFSSLYISLNFLQLIYKAPKMCLTWGPQSHPFIAHAADFSTPLLFISMVLFNDDDDDDINCHLLTTYYMLNISHALFLILRATGSEKWRKLAKAIHKRQNQDCNPNLHSPPPNHTGNPLWKHTQATLFPAVANAVYMASLL